MEHTFCSVCTDKIIIIISFDNYNLTHLSLQSKFLYHLQAHSQQEYTIAILAMTSISR